MARGGRRAEARHVSRAGDGRPRPREASEGPDHGRHVARARLKKIWKMKLDGVFQQRNVFADVYVSMSAELEKQSSF